MGREKWRQLPMALKTVRFSVVGVKKKECDKNFYGFSTFPGTCFTSGWHMSTLHIATITNLRRIKIIASLDYFHHSDMKFSHLRTGFSLPFSISISSFSIF
jgi:hypothetical protein